MSTWQDKLINLLKKHDALFHENIQSDEFKSVYKHLHNHQNIPNVISLALVKYFESFVRQQEGQHFSEAKKELKNLWQDIEKNTLTDLHHGETDSHMFFQECIQLALYYVINQDHLIAPIKKAALEKLSAFSHDLKLGDISINITDSIQFDDFSEEQVNKAIWHINNHTRFIFISDTPHIEKTFYPVRQIYQDDIKNYNNTLIVDRNFIEEYKVYQAFMQQAYDQKKSNHGFFQYHKYLNIQNLWRCYLSTSNPEVPSHDLMPLEIQYAFFYSLVRNKDLNAPPFSINYQELNGFGRRNVNDIGSLQFMIKRYFKQKIEINAKLGFTTPRTELEQWVEKIKQETGCLLFVKALGKKYYQEKYSLSDLQYRHLEGGGYYVHAFAFDGSESTAFQLDNRYPHEVYYRDYQDILNPESNSFHYINRKVDVANRLVAGLLEGQKDYIVSAAFFLLENSNVKDKNRLKKLIETLEEEFIQEFTVFNKALGYEKTTEQQYINRAHVIYDYFVKNYKNLSVLTKLALLNHYGKSLSAVEIGYEKRARLYAQLIASYTANYYPTQIGNNFTKPTEAECQEFQAQCTAFAQKTGVVLYNNLVSVDYESLASNFLSNSEQILSSIQDMKENLSHEINKQVVSEYCKLVNGAYDMTMSSQQKSIVSMIEKCATLKEVVSTLEKIRKDIERAQEHNIEFVMVEESQIQSSHFQNVNKFIDDLTGNRQSTESVWALFVEQTRDGANFRGETYNTPIQVIDYFIDNYKELHGAVKGRLLAYINCAALSKTQKNLFYPGYEDFIPTNQAGSIIQSESYHYGNTYSYELFWQHQDKVNGVTEEDIYQQWEAFAKETGINYAKMFEVTIPEQYKNETVTNHLVYIEDGLGDGQARLITHKVDRKKPLDGGDRNTAQDSGADTSGPQNSLDNFVGDVVEKGKVYEKYETDPLKRMQEANKRKWQEHLDKVNTELAEQLAKKGQVGVNKQMFVYSPEQSQELSDILRQNTQKVYADQKGFVYAVLPLHEQSFHHMLNQAKGMGNVMTLTTSQGSTGNGVVYVTEGSSARTIQTQGRGPTGPQNPGAAGRLVNISDYAKKPEVRVSLPSNPLGVAGGAASAYLLVTRVAPRMIEDTVILSSGKSNKVQKAGAALDIGVTVGSIWAFSKFVASKHPKTAAVIVIGTAAVDVGYKTNKLLIDLEKGQRGNKLIFLNEKEYLKSGVSCTDGRKVFFLNKEAASVQMGEAWQKQQN